MKEELTESLKYADGDSELIQSIIQAKVDFYAAGFDLVLKPKNSEYKQSLEERIESMIRTHEIRKVAAELVKDYCATDNCILHWKVEGNKLEYVTTLQPDRVEYSSTIIGEKLKIELDQDVIDQINALNLKSDKKELSKYPDKYVEAVIAGERYVELRNKDGEFWIVKNTNRRFGGLARPSMRAIFFDIMLMDMLISGDFAVAYFLRRVIEHIKCGEAIPAGRPNDDIKALHADKDMIKLYLRVFKELGETMRIVTDHTVEIDYPMPDPKVFDPTKYEKVEERIHRWGATVPVLLSGKGEGFSQGHLGARRFISQGYSVREHIGDMMEEFVLHPSMSTVLKIPKGSSARTTWDEQNLKDPKQVLEELSKLWDCGVLDNQSFLEQLGQKYDVVRSRKERDLKPAEKKLWQPTFEKSQGLLKDGAPGRPTDGKPKAKPAKQPKPSKSGG